MKIRRLYLLPPFFNSVYDYLYHDLLCLEEIANCCSPNIADSDQALSVLLFLFISTVELYVLEGQEDFSDE